MVATLLGFGTTCSQAGLAITKVTVDNHDIATPLSATLAAQPLRLASSTESVCFHFKSEARAGQLPLRLRYKLEGVDTNWHDLHSHMVVWLRLLDSTGTHVTAGTEINVEGESPQWSGHPEDAPLTPFRAQVTAPIQSARIWVYFISNGEPGSIGQMVVDNVKISIDPSDGSPAKTFDLNCQRGLDMKSLQGLPDQWSREGDRSAIAQVVWRKGPEPRPALLLNDADPGKYGVWAFRDITVPLQPGDRVTLDCETAYSTGRCGTEEIAAYGKLKPGTYWFRVAGFHVNGQPSGMELSLPIIIAPPLVQRAGFWIVMLVAVSTFLAALIRWITKRRMQRQLELMEHRRLLEKERTRIARDIHDDLGATMTQIAMLSEVAQNHANEGVRSFLNDIFSRAQSATRSFDEIVWAIKPENDTLESLIGYLSRFSVSYLNLAGLSFRLDAPESMPPYVLPSTQRHNLFLTAKEALHNVVKHAKATEVWMRVAVHHDVLHLRIEDNGTGAVPAPGTPPSRGSANMKKRMEQIGGHYARTGTPGQGTTVELELPLKESAP
jgi:signal transduction histidine kinase